MDWRALGQAVTARRVELGMNTRQALADVTGLTTRLLSDVENGRRDNYDRVTVARIEKGLRWQPGSVAAVLSGGAPTATAETGLAAASLDPRTLERYGDEMAILTLIAGSGLSRGDALRVALRARQLRAAQYGELVEQVRRWIAEAGGHVEDSNDTGLR